MRICWLLLTAALPMLGIEPENPQEIVRKAIENYRRDAHSVLRYTYTTTEHNAKGVEVTHVVPVDGTPAERVVARNGRPLTPEQQQREREKFDALSKQRASESPAARAHRIAKYHDQSRFMVDVPQAFNFTMLPEETIEGRLNYVIKCLPKPDYQPHDTKSRMFSKFHAKVWIDKQDLRMTKGEADIIDTISIGLVLARICKGGHFELTQRRVADDVWVPKTIDIDGSARIMLVTGKKVDEQIVFDNFKPVAAPEAREIAEAAIR